MDVEKDTAQFSDLAAATGAAQQLAVLRATRPKLTVTIAHPELRKWLRTSPEGQAVENVVQKLLG